MCRSVCGYVMGDIRMELGRVTLEALGEEEEYFAYPLSIVRTPFHAFVRPRTCDIEPGGGGVDGAPGGVEGRESALLAVEDAPLAVNEEGNVGRDGDEGAESLGIEEVEEGGEDGGGAEVAPVDALV
jgi:hypothetical protein